MAPAPPVGRALPEAYTAMSDVTTSANRPKGTTLFHQRRKKHTGLNNVRLTVPRAAFHP